MNITFLIGNGFDINLGLKTRYKDFYQYYIQKEKNDFLAKDIADNYEYWSDLEEGLGKFLENVNENEVDNFFDSLDKLGKHLKEYLLIEENKINWNNLNAISAQLVGKIVEMDSEFGYKEKNSFKKLKNNENNSIYYNFVTFNYTNVLDVIIKNAIEKGIKLGKRKANGRVYEDSLKLPIHIHGTLNKDLIMGVNDNTQIGNEKLKDNRLLNDYLIKSNMLNAIGNNVIEQVQQLIKNSKIIGFFGLSLGDSDRLWREYVADLFVESDKYYIWFVRDEGRTFASASERLRYYDAKKRGFLEKLEIYDEDKFDELKERIIILVNSQLFNLNGIKLEANNGQNEDANRE